eukprot:TRINITY_DN15293_c1_g1_i3.p1 TRINITY_DN15293_c1_g1~~TRINITY_DN15293_c1_g1_i3.p1  ORF type:complete len:348 (+),score=48.30 TRINITY_DN15293_c1_g1_i3:61-1044(+)
MAAADAAVQAPPAYRSVLGNRGQASFLAALVAGGCTAYSLLSRGPNASAAPTDSPSRTRAFRHVTVVATTLWAVSTRLKDVSVVDILWAPMFSVIAKSYYDQTGGDNSRGSWLRRRLVLSMLAAWGTRLAVYLFLRNKIDAWTQGEDYRYRAMRRTFDRTLAKTFGGKEHYWWFSWIQVFMLQGGFAMIVSEPVRAVMQPVEQPKEMTALDWAGSALWFVGFVFEAVGDWQLTNFKEDPTNKGKVMSSGLWSLTRHPNYLGNAMMWWGIGIISQSVPGQQLALVGPAFMNYLLTNVSGVAMLEKAMKRKQGWSEYAQKTSSFLPSLK